MIICAGTLYIFLIMAALNLAFASLGRTKVKTHNIISLAFELRSTSGLFLPSIYLVYSPKLTQLFIYKWTDPVAEKLIKESIIPTIQYLREYPGLSFTLQSKYGINFHDTNLTQIYLDNMPTK